MLDGVDTLVGEVQVEGTFRDGTKLLTVHDPITLEDGSLEEALKVRTLWAVSQPTRSS